MKYFDQYTPVPSVVLSHLGMSRCLLKGIWINLPLYRLFFNAMREFLSTVYFNENICIMYLKITLWFPLSILSPLMNWMRFVFYETIHSVSSYKFTHPHTARYSFLVVSRGNEGTTFPRSIRAFFLRVISRGNEQGTFPGKRSKASGYATQPRELFLRAL